MSFSVLTQTSSTSHRGRFVNLLLPLAALSLLCGFLFFYRLRDRDLWSSHEARAAMNGQTILDDGSWGLPHLYDGRPETQKPPLYYWLVAACARLRGSEVDAWAVRLPSALAAVGTVALLFLFCRNRGRPMAGLIGASILATAIHFTWLARIGRIDMPLTFFVTAAILLGLRLSKSFDSRPIATSRFPALALFYLCLAAGILLKGPLGLVLPLGVLFGQGLVNRLSAGPSMDSKAPAAIQRRPVGIRYWGLIWGGPLVALLTIPWFFWANKQTDGQFLKEFFWHHNLERALGTSPLFEHHGDYAWWFYIRQFGVDFLPWTPLFLFALIFPGRSLRSDRDQEAQIGLVWLAIIAGLLSLASFKRADYLVPAYPGAALFVGSWAERRLKKSARPRVVGAGLATLVAGAAVGWFIQITWIIPEKENVLEYRRFAKAIRGLAPQPERVVFFRTESHELAFHVGRPLEMFVEWERLENWIANKGESWIVMPRHWYVEAPPHLASEPLEIVLDEQEYYGSPRKDDLLLLKTRPPDEALHAPNPEPDSDRLSAAERHSPCPK